MLFSYVKSKLLQLYPNFTRTSPSISVNAYANANKNPVIRKITKLLPFVNQNFGSVFASNRMALQLKSIMTKFPKTSYVALAMCLFLRVERVPFSGRRHLVIRSPKHISIFRTPMVTDIILKCNPFEKNAKVLPSTHEKTLRFESIARKVGQGAHNVLGVKGDFNVMAYEPGLDSRSNPGFMVGQQTSSYNTQKRWSSNNKGFVRGYSTRNLEGREWKVSVIDSPVIGAAHAFGHIIISTGFLDKASDDEVASAIGHEMGHNISEHLMERVMWYLPKAIITATAIIISAFLYRHNNTYNHIVDQENGYYQRYDKIREFVKNVRGRRRELEADHIGMMLMASAGYDPQAALTSLYNFSSCNDLPSPHDTHPSDYDRITYLKSPERMNKAMKLYKEVTSS